ncbi:leucine-rich repeat-containing protein kinase family protein [Rhodoferax aquaticus]|uniref:Protein kinase n=1 Tax=Rhodoferax aquaticus TaxID=2527691 RepID=A0A515EJZ4_9BURK|nr:leucine-rich repeat-containing protein kinase family protein [Rhodoferax aquaticus]QDL52994.1 protein kinase [Rhodoferax aquaticus]
MAHTLAQLRSGELQGCTRLQLALGLEEFPREIFSLADTLEILDLSGNALSELPDDLWRLGKLRVLFCSNNRFTVLPAVVGQCAQLRMVGFKSNQIHTVPAQALGPQLRWLILTDNAVSTLPDSMGQCTQLQKLMLAGNQLTHLPAALAHCTQLELVRISANRFAAFPEVLLTLPNLAWLAVAGNPMCESDAMPVPPEVPQIAWTQLRLGPRVGQGASGVIYRAEWDAPDGTQPVAVKMFKGDVTSDGWPQAEMAACLRAGRHPGLISVMGQVQHHPQGQQGLVMAWVPDDYGVVAGPPSLQSCTRDVYPAGFGLRGPVLVRMAQVLANALAHLHAQGLLHGDLYAHNLMLSPVGDVLLGDFGAASPTDALPAPVAQHLRAMDVRAFGVLLGELLARCQVGSLAVSTLQALQTVHHACMESVCAARPPMSAVVTALAACNPHGENPA